MSFLDRRTQNEVVTQFYRLRILYETEMVTNYNNFKNPFYISVLIEKLIILNDLLQKISPSIRVSFMDAIPQLEVYMEKGNNYADITDLIIFFRNAVCHIDNNRRDYNSSGGTVSFGMSVGKSHFLNDIYSEYEDDACIIMGIHKLYIKRHLVRVYEELKKSYLDVPEFTLLRHILT